ncbi:MAG: hypothetical protein ACREQO_10215 [Candidatus Binatia bacterium]
MDNTYAIKVVLALDRIAEQLAELNRKLDAKGPMDLSASKAPLTDLLKAAHREACNDMSELKAAQEEAIKDMAEK